MWHSSSVSLRDREALEQVSAPSQSVVTPCLRNVLQKRSLFHAVASPLSLFCNHTTMTPEGPGMGSAGAGQRASLAAEQEVRSAASRTHACILSLAAADRDQTSKDDQRCSTRPVGTAARCCRCTRIYERVCALCG